MTQTADFNMDSQDGQTLVDIRVEEVTGGSIHLAVKFITFNMAIFKGT